MIVEIIENIINKSMCSHKNMELTEKVILPSAWEQMSKNHEVKNISLYPAIFRKKVIMIFKCSNCGKVEKIVESNPK